MSKEKSINLDTNTNRLILKGTGNFLEPNSLIIKEQKDSVQAITPKANNGTKNLNLKFEIY